MAAQTFTTGTYDFGPKCKNGEYECLGPGTDDAWQCVDCAKEHYDMTHPQKPQGSIHGSWLFVYGTLCTGGDNAGLLPFNQQRVPALMLGEMHYAPGYQPYPVVKLDASTLSWVHGELIAVGLHQPSIEEIVSMEVGAGYDLRWVHAYKHGEAEPIEAVAFVWPWNEVGALIPGGDWKRRHNLTSPLQLPAGEKHL